MTRRQLLQLGSAGMLGCAGAAVLAHRASAHRVGPAITPLTLPSPISGGGSVAQTASRLNPPPPARPTSWPQLWRPGDRIRSGDVNGPRIVAITCDDGPWPGNTTTVMNHMRNAGLEHDFGLVHFFMVGNYVATFPEVAREVFERGYGIGNHSLTHSTYSASGLAREIPLAQDVFSSVLGWAPELFRAPGLAKADALQAQLYRLGFANILTSTILNDHLLPRISSSQIIANVSRTIHPGNIILLHDGGSHTQTVNAFPGIINTIHSQGYEIVRLEEVLATGTLQYQAAAYEITASEIAAAEATDGADGVIDVVVELRTYLELNTNLSAERRRMVEAMIAEARLAARG